uniref:Cytochrome P450 n=1 Tax=Panagrellus redivivus TaxID=6233 RepID=A0A7E4ZSN4_PANRE
MLAILIITAILTLYFVNHFYLKRRNLPPGPVPLPFIGNIHLMSSPTANYDFYEACRRKYGDVFTLWIASRPFVYICGFKLLQDTVVNEGDTFAGRICLGEFAPVIRGGDYGVVFVDGERWRQTRRFAIQVFRNFGMGKGIMEEKIQLELGYLVDAIKADISDTQNPQNLIPKIEITVASIINQLLFGFAYHDSESVAEFTKVKDILTAHMQTAPKPGTMLAFTWPTVTKYLPVLKDYYYLFSGQFYAITDYVRKQVAAHKDNFDADSEPVDYVDAYLHETSHHEGTYDEEQLVNTCYDIFIAGQETTANTVIFSILYAMNYPEAQAKLQEEFDRVIGSDRRIGLGDKAELPYTQAFINETQRLVNLLPQNLVHRTLQETTIAGYTIPKHTVVVPQISSVLYDETVFAEPLKFKPERFLAEDGTTIRKVDELVPFGMGKRQCLGEALARMELFVLIANLFNQFKFESEDPAKPPSLTKISGVTIQPEPFKCKVTSRY